MSLSADTCLEALRRIHKEGTDLLAVDRLDEDRYFEWETRAVRIVGECLGDEQGDRIRYLRTTGVFDPEATREWWTEHNRESLKNQLVEIRSHIEVLELRLGDRAAGKPAQRPDARDNDVAAGFGVFILMPFDSELDWLHELVRAACEAVGAIATRAEDVFAAGIVIDQVKQKIAEADAVIAVCTGKNANVFYELGIAEATHRPILIAESTDDLPFDTRHFRTQFYGDADGLNSIETLGGRIECAITETVEAKVSAPSRRMPTASNEVPSADVFAAITPTGRRHSYRLVITNRGPGVARNVSADLRSVERPEAQVMVHGREFPIPQLADGQDYSVALAPTFDFPPPYDCALTWEDDSGSRSATLRLSLP